MAFVRKKGKSFYLVHNVREDGRVRQVHLACLGNRPRVTDEAIEQVASVHPQLQIDWQAVRNRASETFSAPYSDAEGLRDLTHAMRELALDLDELNLPLLRERLGAGQAAERSIQDLMHEIEHLQESLENRLRKFPVHADAPSAGLRKAGE